MDKLKNYLNRRKTTTFEMEFTQLLQTILESETFSFVCTDDKLDILEVGGGLFKSDGIQYENVIGKHLFQPFSHPEFVEMVNTHMVCKKQVSKRIIYREGKKSRWISVQIKTVQFDHHCYHLVLLSDQTEFYLLKESATKYIQSSLDYTILLRNNFSVLEISDNLKALQKLRASDVRFEEECLEYFEFGLDKTLVETIKKELSQTGYYEKEQKISLFGLTQNWCSIKAEQIHCSNHVVGYIIRIKNIQSERSMRMKLEETTCMRNQLIKILTHDIRTPLNTIISATDLIAVSEQLDEKLALQVNNIKYAMESLIHIMNEVTEYTQNKSEGDELEETEFDFPQLLESIITLIYSRAKEKGLELYMDMEPRLPRYLLGDATKLKYALKQLLCHSIQYMEKGFIKLSIVKVIRDGKQMIKFTIEDTGIAFQSEFRSFFTEGNRQEEDWDSMNGSDTLNLVFLNDVIKAMGASIYFEKQETESKVFFEINMESNSNEQAVVVKHREEKSLLICSRDTQFIEHIMMMADNLNVLCESIDGKTKSYYTHVLVDQRTYPILKDFNPLMYNQSYKIIYTEDKNQDSNLNKYVDDFIYEPFTSFKVAELLNHESSPKKQYSYQSNYFFKTVNVRVLVVDDNDVNRLVIQNMLKQFEVECDEANSGYNAVEKMKVKRYDIIFLDYIMPELNGVETLRYIRNYLKSDSTVVMLSANFAEETKELLTDVTANDILEKPLELKELSDILIKWLPRNKVIFQNNDFTKDTYIVEDETKIKLFYELPHIDVEAGLKNLFGNMEQYTHIMSSSKKDLEAQLKQLEESNMQQQHELNRLCLHNIKGVLLNIREQKLSKKIQTMEAIMKEGTFDYKSEEYQLFMENLRTLIQKIDYCVTKVEAMNRVHNPINGNQVQNQKRFAELMKQLMYYMDRFEYVSINNCLDQLLIVAAKENQQIIRRAKVYINEFDYDNARDVLSEIIE